VKQVSAFRLALFSSICAVATVSTPALSQTETQSADLESQGLEEIIVTARKRSESMQDVPIAVTAFTQEALERSAARDLQDIQGLAPNLTIGRGGGLPNNGAFYIRGVGTQEVERTVDPAVGVVLDGIFLANSSGSLLNTFDFEAVEVLRGPQGTLFGKNTTGGVINVRRTKPTGSNELRFQASLGSLNRAEFKAVANASVVDQVLAAKVAMAYVMGDSHMRNTLFGDQRSGGPRYLDVVGSVLFTPNEKISAQLTYEHVWDRTVGPLEKNVSGLGNSVNPPEFLCAVFGRCGSSLGNNPLNRFESNYEPEFKTDLDAVTFEANVDIGPGTITSVTGYRATRQDSISDIDGSPSDLFTVFRNQDFYQFSTELRFASDFSDSVDFVAGGQWFQDRNKNLQIGRFYLPILTSGALPAGTEQYQNPVQRRKSAAAFGELHWKVFPELTLTAGGRYTWERKSFQVNAALFNPAFGGFFNPTATGLNFFPSLEAAPLVADAVSFSEFTPKLGIDWKPSKAILLYYVFSRGFRSGGYNGRNTTASSIGPYNPEFVNQHEVGFKGDLFDRSLRFNLAGFYTNYDDKQEEVIQPAPGGFGTNTTTINAAAARLWGLEAELTWVPRRIEGLRVAGNIGYLNSKYKKFCADIDGPTITNTATRPQCAAAIPVIDTLTGAVNQLIPTDNSSLNLRRTPELQWGVTASYDTDVGNGKLGLTSSYRWTKSHDVEILNDPRGRVPSEGLVDASITYTLNLSSGSEMIFSLFGRNLTDKTHLQDVAVVPQILAFGFPTIGRTWGVSFGGKF
jgi:iron complex outermembrane recepter protein